MVKGGFHDVIQQTRKVYKGVTRTSQTSLKSGCRLKTSNLGGTGKPIKQIITLGAIHTILVTLGAILGALSESIQYPLGASLGTIIIRY